VDSHVEQIVNLLEEKGELENTYIIYTSDNGFQLGQHRLWVDKRHMYENDIRIPFIITGPGIPKNVTTDLPVLNVDIAPSIYDSSLAKHRLLRTWMVVPLSHICCLFREKLKERDQPKTRTTEKISSYPTTEKERNPVACM
jgi:arylsulfatase A-like enzyme